MAGAVVGVLKGIMPAAGNLLRGAAGPVAQAVGPSVIGSLLTPPQQQPAQPR